MNTNHPIKMLLQRSLIFFCLVIVSVLFYSAANAQNKNDNELRVKIYSNDNGKIINIDTTFADEKSADAFLKKNNFGKPEPPVPPIPPAPSMPGVAPTPPLPPLPPVAPIEKGSGKNKQKQIEIYADKDMREEMQDLKIEMEKLQAQLSEEMEELKDFKFELHDSDDDDNDGKKQRVVIKNFDNGKIDTLKDINFEDWDEMQKNMPCLDSAETGYKYFYKIDDDDDDKDVSGVKKRKHQTVIITKEGKTAVKSEKRKKGESKTNKKKAEK